MTSSDIVTSFKSAVFGGRNSDGKTENKIGRTKSQIEKQPTPTDGMLKDHSIPIWQPIEANKNLKELAAYLKGLECQTEYLNIATTVTISSTQLGMQRM